MKSLSIEKYQAQKRGVASLYVVIFATILFGVITLSCMRVMLSEFAQSSDDDLSRSAYDAAMAGVEDAKLAVNRYYECINGSGINCGNKDLVFKQNCDSSIGIAEYLYGYTANADGNPEVVVQEGNSANNADQAYTCVIVNDVTPDYRGTLTSDTRTRVVPLGVKNENSGNTLSRVRRVRLSWYSQLNEGSETGGLQGFKNVNGSGKFNDADSSTVPPTLAVTLIKAGSAINTAEYREANNENQTSLVLLPSAISDTVTQVSGQALRDASSTQVSEHDPILVNCSTTADFACKVDLDVNFANVENAFLVVTLPYGETVTDFSIAMYDGEGKQIDFKGVQVSVDSTGRTNQLVRRVETRLEPSDLYFPFPQYALEVGGNGDDSITKNFRITANCWYSSKYSGGGACDNNNNF